MRKEGLQTAGESPVLVYPFRSPLRARNVYGTFYFGSGLVEPSRHAGSNARPFASTAESVTVWRFMVVSRVMCPRAGCS